MNTNANKRTFNEVFKICNSIAKRFLSSILFILREKLPYNEKKKEQKVLKLSHTTVNVPNNFFLTCLLI